MSLVIIIAITIASSPSTSYNHRYHVIKPITTFILNVHVDVLWIQSFFFRKAMQVENVNDTDREESHPSCRSLGKSPALRRRRLTTGLSRVGVVGRVKNSGLQRCVSTTEKMLHLWLDRTTMTKTCSCHNLQSARWVMCINFPNLSSGGERPSQRKAGR